MSIERHRFARDGRVVRDTRRLMPYIGSDDYRTGMAIFVPRASSEAREKFKAERAARRRKQVA